MTVTPPDTPQVPLDAPQAPAWHPWTALIGKRVRVTLKTPQKRHTTLPLTFTGEWLSTITTGLVRYVEPITMPINRPSHPGPEYVVVNPAHVEWVEVVEDHPYEPTRGAR